MKEKISGTFYKYRSLQNFERFLDIIVNNRLYGAIYTELNDPLEDNFNHAGVTSEDYKKTYSQL